MSALVVACSDLDRTLIYSAAALHLDMPDAVAPALLCVEVYQGKPLSFITRDAARVLANADPRQLVLVPTTTRTPEQLARVHLPGASRYAIASNGGHLLVDGIVDPDWSAQVARRLAGTATVAEVYQEFSRQTGQPFIRLVRMASDLFVYAVVERADLPADLLEHWRDWCDVRGWGVSVQGRKVYAVPTGLTKSAAAQEVSRRINRGDERYIAAGDSLLDAELLAGASRAARPSSGELAESKWACPGLFVAPRPGVLGGEDLAHWLVEGA